MVCVILDVNLVGLDIIVFEVLNYFILYKIIYIELIVYILIFIFFIVDKNDYLIFKMMQNCIKFKCDVRCIDIFLMLVLL